MCLVGLEENYPLRAAAKLPDIDFVFLLPATRSTEGISYYLRNCFMWIEQKARCYLPIKPNRYLCDL